MATIRSLLIRIGVTSERVTSGVAKVNKSLDSMADRVDKLEKIGRAGQFAALAGAAIQLGRAFAPAATAIGHLAVAAAPAAGAILALPAAFAVANAAMAVFKVGIIGVGDAMSAVATGDAKKLNESLKKLAPSARQFVTAMAQAKKAFDPVQRAVQQKLFEGLGAQIRTLASRNLPLLRTGMVSVAASFNGIGRAALRAAATPLFSRALAGVLSVTASTMRAFTPAVAPLVTALTRLVVIGLPLVRMFGQWAGRMATAGAQMLASQRTAARLTATVDRAAGVFKRNGDAAKSMHNAMGQIHVVWDQLSRIGKNVFGVIQSVGTAMGSSAGPSKNLLFLITQLTDRMAKWAASAKGQDQLRQLFTSLQQVASNLIEILPQLAGVLNLILRLINSLPGPVRNTMLQMLAWSIVLGRLTGPLGLAAKLVGGLGKAGLGLGRRLGNSESGLRRFIGRMGEVGRSAATAAANIAKAAVSSAVSMAKWAASAALAAARVVGGWILMGVQSLIQAARMAAAWIIAMGPVGWIITGIVLLVGLIILNWDKISKFTVEIWGKVWGFISGVVGKIVDFVKGHWRQLVAIILGPLGIIVGLVTKHWSQIRNFIEGAIRRVIAAIGWLAHLPGRVGGYFARMLSSVVNAVGRMLTYVSKVPDRIFRYFSGAGKWLVNVGKNIIIGLWNGLVSMASWLGRSLMNLVKRIIPGVVQRVLGIASPSRVMMRLGGFAGQGLAQGLLGTTGLVERAAGMLAGAAMPGAPAFAGASPRGVSASAGLARAGRGGGMDAGTLARAVAQALSGTTVQMDGQPVGQIVSRHLGRATDQRRRTG